LHLWDAFGYRRAEIFPPWNFHPMLFLPPGAELSPSATGDIFEWANDDLQITRSDVLAKPEIT